MKKSISPVVSPFRDILVILFFFAGISPVFMTAEPLYSPTWGFRMDLPEGYTYRGGNGTDRFSFFSDGQGGLDAAVYAGTAYPSPEALTADIQKRLGNRGEIVFFEYRNKKAALLELAFAAGEGAAFEGWGLCVELAKGGEPTGPSSPPWLVALAYGPAGKGELQNLHLSALDSIAPSEADRYAPGPITEFTYPRGGRVTAKPAGLDLPVPLREFDAQGAQALVDREFAVLRLYGNSPVRKEAWARFYRAVYRDSFERLAGAAFALERYWNVPAGNDPADPGTTAAPDRALAEKALNWVQSFTYERDLLGSDFVNLVSAAFEGRGDCDSRALLWALILEQANIPGAIMVSAEYKHAMGLADLPGTGARFPLGDTRWLVAETTAPVSLGRIRADVSEISRWMGIRFE
ncbi:MAG: GyrI-like domain-containing protein [Spirochaetaceae bacterium]|jgi:hypothetical protein|nr:GyrI-like domain-containing protein [Spirochaetaceae bacterium]